MKRQVSLFLALAMLALMMTGCTPTPAGDTSAPAPALGYEEGTSPSDEIVNTTAAEKVILVVSFGTSYNQSRHQTIGGIETAIQAAYPDYQVRRAFTSQIIIDKLAQREGLVIDNVTEAMNRLVLDKVKEVIVQPTTVLNGYEYDDMIAELAPFADQFESLKIGRNLLAQDADFDRVAELLVEQTQQFRAEGSAIVFMGHGTEHAAGSIYTKLQDTLNQKGYSDYIIGTVEHGISIEDVQEMLAEQGATRVILRPLMIVAGDHANNDMAGDEEDSWKVILTQAGYEVEIVMEGLGQIPGIQELFVSHIQDALDAPAQPAAPSAPQLGLSANRIQNGTYSIQVDSSSAMFKIVDCQLTVEDETMTAVMTLSGQGFEKVYMGTGEEAEQADPAALSNFVVNGERHAFTVTVPALDLGVECTGLSLKKQQWYDHTVVFKADDLPREAILPVQIDVTLTGGTGRASVDSPASLDYQRGQDVATIQWSSPNYIYMVVDGVEYLPVNTTGNSTFEIPVQLDTDMAVVACTVAMSEPKEIEYTLRFDAASMRAW